MSLNYNCYLYIAIGLVEYMDVSERKLSHTIETLDITQKGDIILYLDELLDLLKDPEVYRSIDNIYEKRMASQNRHSFTYSLRIDDVRTKLLGLKFRPFGGKGTMYTTISNLTDDQLILLIHIVTKVFIEPYLLNENERSIIINALSKDTSQTNQYINRSIWKCYSHILGVKSPVDEFNRTTNYKVKNRVVNRIIQEARDPEEKNLSLNKIVFYAFILIMILMIFAIFR